MADVFPPSAALVFVTKMSDKLKFTSPSEIQVKNRQKTVRTEEKLHYYVDLKKVNEWLTYAVMLDSLVVAYIQFEIVLTELQKVVGQ